MKAVDGEGKPPGPGPLTVAAVAALLVAAFLNGCGRPEAGTARQIVKEALRNQNTLKSVRMEVERETELVSGPQSRTVDVETFKGVYEQPDKWKLTVRSQGAKAEVIIIGERAYLKYAGAQEWDVKDSKGLLGGGSGGGEVMVSDYLKSARDVQMLDEKGDTYHLVLNTDIGVCAESFRVRGLDPSLFANRNVRTEIWVHKETLYLERALVAFESNLTNAPGRISVHTQAEFYDQNEPVTVEPPV